MGTSIELTLGGLSLDYAKNHMGNDHGHLFQESDRVRRHADGINYEWFADHANDKELAREEVCFARQLKDVLPRLDLLGWTKKAAQTEYNLLLEEVGSYADTLTDEDGRTTSDYMPFDEFCTFCNQFKIDELDDKYIEWDTDERDRIARGRFDILSEALKRIPHNVDQSDIFWSERSYFGTFACILSPYAMLQVFGSSDRNLQAEVIWQFGPIVEAGWVAAEAFKAGARRLETILVATEGTSDARILRRAFDVFRPEVADFFRFVDVDQRHPFPGTGNLTKFAEGLVHIDVQNRILFVLDNDAEGLAGLLNINALQKPINMRAILLPRLGEFTMFPARGPEGIVHSDINERAASIECYLALNIPGRPNAEIIWSNYKKEVDRWQGALAFKETYTRYFLEQCDEALRNGSYEAGRIKTVLDCLIKEATALAMDDLGEADR